MSVFSILHDSGVQVALTEILQRVLQLHWMWTPHPDCKSIRGFRSSNSKSNTICLAARRDCEQDSLEDIIINIFIDPLGSPLTRSPAQTDTVASLRLILRTAFHQSVAGSAPSSKHFPFLTARGTKTFLDLMNFLMSLFFV